MTAFFRGFGNFFQAFGFVFRNGLFWVYILPLALWLILFFFGIFTIFESADLWVESVFDKLSQHQKPGAEESFWAKSLYWLVSATRILGKWIFRIAIVLILGRILKYIILILTAPVIAWLSEKAEEIITGNTYPFSWKVFLRDSWRGVRIAFRNLFLELTCYLAGFILTLIFAPAAIIIGPLLFVMSAYFMGFSMYDYMAERQKMNLRTSVHWIRQNKYEVIGLGLAYNLISLIPAADMIIAPVNGSVGAVLNRFQAGSILSDKKAL